MILIFNIYLKELGTNIAVTFLKIKDDAKINAKKKPKHSTFLYFRNHHNSDSTDNPKKVHQISITHPSTIGARPLNLNTSPYITYA